MDSQEMNQIVDKIRDEKRLSKIDIIKMLKMDDPKVNERLLAEAGKYTEKYCGAKEFYLFALMRISNYCSKNCAYCGNRKFNIELDRYRMDEADIIKLAESTWHDGFHNVVISSGCDDYYSIKRLTHIIQGIKDRTELDIIMNVGERPIEEFQIMKNYGVKKCILKHETSDPELYESLHPDRNFENRIRTIKDLKKLGFSAGSGIIAGLPDQSYDSLAKDILLLKNLNIDIIWIDPFLPHKNVPLSEHPRGDEMLTLKFIALTRVVTKDTFIGISCDYSCGKKSIDAKAKAIQSGANVFFAETTPTEYWFNHHAEDEAVCMYKKCKRCIRYLAKKSGYQANDGYANRQHDRSVPLI